MITNIVVAKTGSENSMAVLRRFTKRVQGSGILKRVRSLRYKERNASPNTRKKKALKRINRRKEVDVLIKLGKMQEKTGPSR